VHRYLATRVQPDDTSHAQRAVIGGSLVAIDSVHAVIRVELAIDRKEYAHISITTDGTGKVESDLRGTDVVATVRSSKETLVRNAGTAHRVQLVVACRAPSGDAAPVTPEFLVRNGVGVEAHI